MGRETETLTKILLGAVIGALAIRIALVFLLPKNLAGNYVLMPCRMDGSAMGGLVAIAVRESAQWLHSRWIAWVTVLSAAVFVLIGEFYGRDPWSIPMRTIGYTAIALAFTGVLVMLIVWRQPVLLAICRLRFLVWVGTISYGMYLLHIPVLDVSHRWIAPLLRIRTSGSTEFILMIALTMGAAWISWTIFESPILRLKDRFTVRDPNEAFP